MEQINIELVPSGVMSTAHASQFDIGRGIRFNLKDGGTPYTLAGTETITIEMVKPDGSEQTISLTNTSSTYVDWTTADGELDLDGVYSAEISIVQGDDVLGTKNFLVRVEPDPYNGKGLRVVTVGPADICTFEPTISEPLVNVKCTLTPSLDGYSAVNLTACGVNLWDEEWELGNIVNRTGENSDDNTRLRCKNFIPVKGGVSYYFYNGSDTEIDLFAYDVNKTFLGVWTSANGFIVGSNSANDVHNTIKTLPDECAYIKIKLTPTYSTSYNNDISILYPSDTTPAYYPYTGNVYAIALGDIYYGGTLDVTRGKLHVTHLAVDMGSLTWTKQGTTSPHWRFRAYIDGIKQSASSTAIADIKCSIFTAGSSSSTWVGTDKIIAVATDADAVFVTDEDYSDASTFTSAVNGQTICYELATPIEIDLGSGTAVTARAGVNNVFADCGQTEVKYLTIEA